MMLKCTICKEEKTPDQFIKQTSVKHSYTKNCQECRQRDLDRYYANREKKLAYQNARNKERVEDQRAYARNWRKRSDTAGKGYTKRRSGVDPIFKKTQDITSKTKLLVIVSGRSKVGEALVGCTTAEFRLHLESQFEPGMTWENYGGKDGWSIDHHFPLSVAAKAGDHVLEKAVNYRNIKPRWRRDNKAKHNSLPPEYPTVEAFLKAW